MRELLIGGRAILLDFASTLVFFALYALTDNLGLAVGAGIALALTQIGWRLSHGQPVDALQWISLVTIVAGGTATLVSHDARFIMLKPTVIYALVGLVMLRRGWMNRYIPARALASVPDLVVMWGYIWAGAMLFSAALNILLALTCSFVWWGTLMSVWGATSKPLLVLTQIVSMKLIGKRRAKQRAIASTVTSNSCASVGAGASV
ncbi:intracellular septation protein [Altererythrobacter indicus]|uniref:Intracellular septation protein n=1 Tax=Altericroceibacterium indicum TaxID=374177 RepID=A0A845A734_9SPHN|nr:septation protein IspZ [Altericroceibacterium indicum]MXP25357.1 intracellular septation protein [Altericroceibacterium indicum]